MGIYFKKQWLDSKLSICQLFNRAIRLAFTNSPLESYNGRIKGDFTDRSYFNLVQAFKKLAQIKPKFYSDGKDYHVTVKLSKFSCFTYVPLFSTKPAFYEPHVHTTPIRFHVNVTFYNEMGVYVFVT